ncbi:MAG TPA: hypothetical protein VKV27_11515 [Solirubrobacteraceae bacterium]|nr:hypothetical protein [Solirubrobacteraceae bacterium]
MRRVPIDAGGCGPSHTTPIDTRRHRLAAGAVGLALVVAFSVAHLTAGGGATIGIPAGDRLPAFAAPLATSDLRGSPTTRPTCDPARHDPRALNLCLILARSPVALAFFVPRARVCVGQVDALQRLARRYPGVAFAAVAIATRRATAARLVRARHWTIPVAYDPDGQIGALYGVAACPMVELARRGGLVFARLIGDRWAGAATLAQQVRMLLRSR